MLWLCIGKADYKALPIVFVATYLRNYVIMRIISIKNMVSYGLFLFSVKKLKSLLKEKTPCHSSFWDHLRSDLETISGLGCTDALWSMALMGHGNNFFILFSFSFSNLSVFLYIFQFLIKKNKIANNIMKKINIKMHTFKNYTILQKFFLWR